jgi:hypothetical protein
METKDQEARPVPHENPIPQVGDTWAVTAQDVEGPHAVLVVVRSRDPEGGMGDSCQVEVVGQPNWKPIQQTIPTRWLQQNVLVSRKAEVFGPQLQAILFDLGRQLSLLQEVADRLCEPAPIQVLAQDGQESPDHG